MITVVGRGDMEAALREPEKYRNLIVRVVRVQRPFRRAYSRHPA